MHVAFGKKRLLLGVFITLVLVGFWALYFYLGGYDAWRTKRNYERAMEAQKRIEDAYRNDIYGGKTPQETLDMFIEALRAGDIELASKYFALDDALGRGEWLPALKKAKDEGRLGEIVGQLLTVRPLGSSYQGDFGFGIYGADGVVETLIDLEFNPVSKIWKIESL